MDKKDIKTLNIILYVLIGIVMVFSLWFGIEEIIYKNYKIAIVVIVAGIVISLVIFFAGRASIRKGGHHSGL